MSDTILLNGESTLGWYEFSEDTKLPVPQMKVCIWVSPDSGFITIKGEVRGYEILDVQVEDFGDGQSEFLCVSDGTVIEVYLGKEGIWRLARVHAGSAIFEKIEGDTQTRTDKICLTGSISWFACAHDWDKWGEND